MKILLADDHGLFRDSMSVWLKQLDSAFSFDFADSYQSAKTFLEATHDYKLVMLDLGMPEMQGIISIKSLCSLANSIPVLIVSADESGNTIQSAMDAGASGYVPKSSSGEKILDAVKNVMNGKLYFPTGLKKSDSLLNKFNDKQQQLLSLLAEGNSNKEISKKLFLSEGTIKQYVSQIFRILDVDNRTQAGLKAREILRIGTS